MSCILQILEKLLKRITNMGWRSGLLTILAETFHKMKHIITTLLLALTKESIVLMFFRMNLK